MTDFKRSHLASLAALLAASGLAVAQENKDAKPINVSAQATPVAVAVAGQPTIEKEETVKVTTMCLTGNAAWFQRQMELTDGDVAPQQESIRRCFRIVRVAEGNTAK